MEAAYRSKRVLQDVLNLVAEMAIMCLSSKMSLVGFYIVAKQNTRPELCMPASCVASDGKLGTTSLSS